MRMYIRASPTKRTGTWPDGGGCSPGDGGSAGCGKIVDDVEADGGTVL